MPSQAGGDAPPYSETNDSDFAGFSHRFQSRPHFNFAVLIPSFTLCGRLRILKIDSSASLRKFRRAPINPMKLLRILSLLIMTTLTSTPLQAESASLQIIPLKDIDGKDTSLKSYSGKVVLLVNVASKCGLTKQYEALQGLYDKYKDQGLVVIGLPCNDFGGQEPGTNAEVKEFCSTNYKVTFPLMDKLHVKGAEQHPLYAELTGPNAKFPGEIKWNFGKFLVARDGKVIARFEPKTMPDEAEVTAAIEAALAAK